MPQMYPKEEAERRADEMTRASGIKHVIMPWESRGSEILYVIGRKIDAPSPGSGEPSERAS